MSPENEEQGQLRARAPAPTFITFIADTWRIVRRRFFPLLGLFIFANFVAAGIILTALNAIDPSSDSVRLLIESSGLVLDTIAAGLAGIWAAHVWVNDMNDREVSLSSGGSIVRRRLGALFVACFVTGLFIVFLYLGLGSAGLLIMGFMLAVPFTAGPPVLLHVIGLEDCSFGAAIPRARALLKGAGLRTFVYLLMLGLLATLLTGIALTLAGTGIVQTGVAGGSLTLIGLALSSVFLGLTDVFLSAGLLTAYLDARTRAEEFELEDLVAEAPEEA